MKKLLPLILLLISLHSKAQNTEQKINEKVIDAFLPLISTLEVDSKVYQMKKDGVMNRKFEAGVALKGHIDVSEDDEFLVHIVPYELRLTETGRVFVEVSPISLQAEYGEDLFIKLQALSIEYDKNYNYSALTERTFRMMKLGGQVPIGNDRSKVLIQGQAEVLGGSTLIGATPNLYGDTYKKRDKLYSFSNNFSYGLEYKQKFDNDMSLNINVTGKHKLASSSHNKSYQEAKDYQALNTTYHNQWQDYHLAVDEWEAEKFQWEVENGYLNGTDNSHYIAATGNQLPDSADYVTMPRPTNEYKTIKRHQFAVQPRIGVEKTFENKNGFIKGIGAEFNANIIVTDKLKGTNQYMTPYDQNGEVNIGNSEFTDSNRYNLKLILKF